MFHHEGDLASTGECLCWLSSHRDLLWSLVSSVSRLLSGGSSHGPSAADTVTDEQWGRAESVRVSALFLGETEAESSKVRICVSYSILLRSTIAGKGPDPVARKSAWHELDFWLLLYQTVTDHVGTFGRWHRERK